MTKAISGDVVHQLPADLQKALTSDPKALAVLGHLTPLARRKIIVIVNIMNY